jgi:hypothetical protein
MPKIRSGCRSVFFVWEDPKGLPIQLLHPRKYVFPTVKLHISGLFQEPPHLKLGEVKVQNTLCQMMTGTVADHQALRATKAQKANQTTLPRKPPPLKKQHPVWMRWCCHRTGRYTCTLQPQCLSLSLIASHYHKVRSLSLSASHCLSVPHCLSLLLSALSSTVSEHCG